MEAFDEALSQRVHALSQAVDEQTERVVDCRKTVPMAYAAAVARRAAARRAVADAHEEHRQKRLRTSKRLTRYPSITRGQPLCVDAEARARIQATLHNVYATLQSLHDVRVLHNVHMLTPHRHYHSDVIRRSSRNASCVTCGAVQVRRNTRRLPGPLRPRGRMKTPRSTPGPCMWVRHLYL